jgi:carbon monoxide dehydrogenase subunit G
VGPFLVRMELAIEVLANDAPNSIRVEISGNDLKLKSHIRQLLDIRLSQGRDSGTAVDIQATLVMNGVLASLGKSLIEMQVRQVLNDFSEAFQAKMRNGYKV